MSLQLPNALLAGLSGLPGFEMESFLSTHQQGEVPVSIRCNPAKIKALPIEKYQGAAIPWATHGWYLPERISFIEDPYWQGGAYYVQEASSMLLEQFFVQHLPLSPAIKVLDLCAAPGGKSTHLQSLIGDQGLLVSNEVIQSRVTVLRENVARWGAANVVITNNDPKDFQSLQGFFDVIVIDAPCSGSGLFRRDPEAIGQWSEANVSLCSQRQQRILADVWPALKPGGMLLYSTCSFSKEEDEDVLDWINDQFEVEPLSINVDAAWGVTLTQSKSGANGYRCWPHLIKGEGFFIGGFIKKEGVEMSMPKMKQPSLPTKVEQSILDEWVMNEQALSFIQSKVGWHAIPVALVPFTNWLQQTLHVKGMGVLMGEINKSIFIPHETFAFCTLVAPSIPKIPLSSAEIQQFIRKENLMNPNPDRKGWALACVGELPIGWVKQLPNRLNNYFPTSWRVRKAY